MDADTNLVQLCFNLGINNCEKIAIKDVNAYHDLVIKIIEANKKRTFLINQHWNKECIADWLHASYTCKLAIASDSGS